VDDALTLYKAYIDAFRGYFQLDSSDVPDVTLAAAVTSAVAGDPLWAYIVGPPSTIKTEAVRPFSSLDPKHAIFLSSLTPNALISGLRDAHDLLPELDKKLFIVKDFTTVLNMNRETRDALFGQLRDAFDGSMSRATATRGRIIHESHFNMLAAVTSAIENYYSAQGILGQRFVLIRSDFPTTFKSDAERDIVEIRRHLAELVKPIVLRTEEEIGLPTVTDAHIAFVKDLAKEVATLRTHVDRESGTHDVLTFPEPEGPPRLTNQFLKLLQGIAYVRGKDVTEDTDLDVVRRVAVDTIPSMRARVVAALEGGAHTIDEVAIAVRVNRRTVERKLEDLVMLGVVDEYAIGKPYTYSLTTLVPLCRGNIYKDVQKRASDISSTPDTGVQTPVRTSSQRDRVQVIHDAALRLQRASETPEKEGTFSESELIGAVTPLGIQPADVISQLADWKKGGDTMEPRHGRLRLVEI